MCISSNILIRGAHPGFQENRFYPKAILKFKKNNQQLLQSKVQSSTTPIFKEGQNKNGKTVQYVILILYTRPEFGERCEFLSTYYAKEENVNHLKKIFAKAFKSAHPTWTMTEITVSPA